VGTGDHGHSVTPAARPGSAKARPLELRCSALSILFLIRHGQASYGAADYDQLSERGRRQAVEIGRHFAGTRVELDALYAGPLRRQRDTAILLHGAARDAGVDLPGLQIIDELAEYDAFTIIQRFLPALADADPVLRPLIDGTAGSDALRLMDRAFEAAVVAWSRGDLAHDEIESFEAFTARVRGGLERVLGAHGGGRRVAVVSSGGPISVAVALALALGPDATMAIGRAVRNASITEVRWRSREFAWRPGEFSLYGFNHVAHLEHDRDLITYR
jgi:broad specificity phosphatase PhoE